MAKGGCEEAAKKIHKAIGGDIMTISSPIPGTNLGGVNVSGTLVTWFNHQAVKKGNMIYDEITGPAGMLFEDYKKLFQHGDELLFEIKP